MLALTLWLTVLLAAAATGIIVGLPLWMVLRHPDRDPAESRRLPAYLEPQVETVPADRPIPPARDGRERELAGAGAR